MDQAQALELVEQIKGYAKSANYSSSELTAFIACTRQSNLDTLSPGKVKDERIRKIYYNANRVLSQIICTLSEDAPGSLFATLLAIHSELTTPEEVDSKEQVFGLNQA